MKRHTKIYLDYFGYTTADWIGCEVCGQTANDIHHIDARQSGGDPQGKKDVIENLMAVCRPCHTRYGDKKQHKEMLKNIHAKRMSERNL